MQFRLSPSSGVPIYRQIIDQVIGAVASGKLHSGDQLPTVRQVAVDLSVNPNTVVRAYRELEIRGLLETQQGSGTFISDKKFKQNEGGRERRLEQLATEFVTRAGEEGFTVGELMEVLNDRQNHAKKRR